MNLPKWMPPMPELPWTEGSPLGNLPPEAVRKWGYDYALNAIEAYKASLKPVAWIGKDGGLYKHPVPSTVPLYRLDEE